jgi:hypothetical protein
MVLCPSQAAIYADAVEYGCMQMTLLGLARCSPAKPFWSGKLNSTYTDVQLGLQEQYFTNNNQAVIIPVIQGFEDSNASARTQESFCNPALTIFVAMAISRVGSSNETTGQSVPRLRKHQPPHRATNLSESY